MSTPGDYYERQAKEARRLRALLAWETQKPNPDLKRIAQLTLALERATYVGD